MSNCTDITIIKKNTDLINTADISELILESLNLLGCYTKLDERNPEFDRAVKMRFINGAMIGRFPIFYPYSDGEVESEYDGCKYTQRTPEIYYALGSIDREGFEGCEQALQTMNDFVTVHVDSNESGIELIKSLGVKILTLSREYRVFFRKTDGNNEYYELFI